MSIKTEIRCSEGMNYDKSSGFPANPGLRKQIEWPVFQRKSMKTGDWGFGWFWRYFEPKFGCF